MRPQIDFPLDEAENTGAGRAVHRFFRHKSDRQKTPDQVLQAESSVESLEVVPAPVEEVPVPVEEAPPPRREKTKTAGGGGSNCRCDGGDCGKSWRQRRRPISFPHYSAQGQPGGNHMEAGAELS